MAQDISTYLFDVVNSSHTFATGGTSTMERWWVITLTITGHISQRIRAAMAIFCFNFVLQTRHDPKRLVDEIKISSNEETCATYNLLKVSLLISDCIPHNTFLNLQGCRCHGTCSGGRRKPSTQTTTRGYSSTGSWAIKEERNLE